MPLPDIANLAVALGFFLLAYQIYLQRRDQRNQRIVQLFEELMAPDFREKIHFVFSRTPEDLVFDRLTDPQQMTVTEVTARFEALGFKVRVGVVPKKESIEAFWDWIVRCAQQLDLHIRDQRALRGEMETYRADFDWLARECKLFHLKKLHKKVPTKNMTLSDLLKVEPLPMFSVKPSLQAFF